MRIDGGCHCGRIRYRAEIDPSRVNICHCTDCQVLTGTAFRVTAPVADKDLEITGEPKVYVKIAESGNPRAQGFCPDCGTPIFATSVGDGPKIYGIRVGTARQCKELVPKFQLWCQSAQHWLSDLPDLPQSQRQ